WSSVQSRHPAPPIGGSGDLVPDPRQPAKTRVREQGGYPGSRHAGQHSHHFHAVGKAHMSARGRHSRRSGMTFYRDALLLIGGIVLVGAIVFGGLSLWAGSSNDDPGGGSTTVTTDPQNTTTTTSPVTTTTPTSADTSVADTTG